MAIHQDITKGKSLGDLGLEAFWFVTHTLIAVIILAAAIAAISFTHPDPDASSPKVVGTVVAFLVPMIGGFIVTKMQQNDIAGYVWISGILLFSVVCVWVLDLPTGNGLCEKCGAIDKLWRTFFDINHGSGLMGGDGLLVGTWIPLSMIGYAVGAKFAITED
jgi:hypothetical protein